MDRTQRVKLIAEDIHLYDIIPKELTSDCYTVIRMDGTVDIVKSSRMVDVFDLYYDLGVKLKRIEMSGGLRDPRFQEPQFGG